MKRKLILLVIAVGMLTLSGIGHAGSIEYIPDIDAKRKAAEQGYAMTQNTLGAIYESGEVVPCKMSSNKNGEP